MNILISGGFGFIGSHLVDVLLSAGHNIGIISRGQAPDYFPYREKCEIIVADITNEIDCKPKVKYDLFIHLAAANDIESKNPDTALSVTTLGTKNVLEFCFKHEIKKFIYFSTFQVYGRDEGYVDEKTQVELKNHYALTHYFAEKYVEFFNKKFGMEYLIVRPTNVFGGMLHRNSMRWSLVPGCLCREAYETQNIKLLSSGKQARDFISVEKVCNAVIKIIELFNTMKNNIFNLGSGESVSILEVANMVKESYEEKYNKTCTIEILSEIPVNSSELNVNTGQLEELNIYTKNRNSLFVEINKIFQLLEMG